MFTIDVSGVIGLLIEILLVVIFMFAIPWVAKKNPTIATFLTKFILPLFVYGAEKYLTGLSGEEKRNYVLTLFGKLNFNVDPAIVRIILEGICEKLDIEQGKYTVAAATLVEGLVDTIQEKKN